MFHIQVANYILITYGLAADTVLNVWDFICSNGSGHIV